ncbi:MAG: type II toxin-antitoxin system RelE/ParE family toxin [Synergistaceae bacterium]|nr:type II toxin-antitoxin system RelE/ParE family toxin [Synergistota bacterium]NLM71038.1 type II toxin-antitoxin system RelE/ParE family toxin [Synergistaceae bacterium]
MIKYRVEIDRALARRIKKLDRQVRELLDRYISTHLEGTTEPRRYGRPLAGGLDGLWRYRIGDWRLIVKIIDDKLLILALEFDRRDVVYKQ